ncbi:MAG TPA: class I SAM-dependent methyltransferase [Opitutaceae bacterium]|nr:class I SAM-dependent methyltransferase [Opitutaceae bacterium]
MSTLSAADSLPARLPLRYKSTWENLAKRQEGAVMYVSGYQDEERLYATMEDTLGILRDTVGIHATDVFLEIGCGVGRVGRGLAPFVKEWIGCDVSAEMIRQAQRKTLGLPNVRFVEVSGHDLQPVPDASVDVVYCTVVFMHLDEWDRYAYCLEAKRILKPGGRFYCDNANIASAEGWEMFEGVRTRFAPGERPAQASRCSSVPEFETFFAKAGFENWHVATRPMWVYGWGTKPLES